MVDNETEWVTFYLTSVSDLAPSDLIKMVESDVMALHRLVQLDTQLNLEKLRMTPTLLKKDVL